MKNNEHVQNGHQILCNNFNKKSYKLPETRTTSRTGITACMAIQPFAQPAEDGVKTFCKKIPSEIFPFAKLKAISF